MKTAVICLLLAGTYCCSPSLAQETQSIPEKINQELLANKTAGSQKDTKESDISKKFFIPIVHHEENEDNDDFYPKPPPFPHLFYPFLHHQPYHYDEPKPPEHHEKPKPPHKPLFKPIHKPAHFKPPPIVIHHKPIHKPVHIHIHKGSLHGAKPHHKPPQHEDHHPQGYHKPPKTECDSNCTKLDDGVETINIPEEEVHELAAVEDDTKYSIDQESDQSYVNPQLDTGDNYDKYEQNFEENPIYQNSRPSYHNTEDSSAESGIRMPVTSLADLLSDLRPVPWYSQHQEENDPERKPLSEMPSHIPNEDHKKHCEVHHHYHYYYPNHHIESPHPPPHPPNKPHNPSYYPIATKREVSTGSIISTTESTLSLTVDPKITIPYNEYDVSTQTSTEEGKPEVESHSQKPTRKPKPNSNYKQISQMLLWPFTPKPTRTKSSKKPSHTVEHERKAEKSDEENENEDEDEDDATFSDFFELK